MTRTGLCARPACGCPVAAWLTYDYAGQQVWLDGANTPGGGDGSRWALCAGHADRLRVPVGWAFQDRRTGHRLPTPLQSPAAIPRAPGQGDGAQLVDEASPAVHTPLLPAVIG